MFKQKETLNTVQAIQRISQDTQTDYHEEHYAHLQGAVSKTPEGVWWCDRCRWENRLQHQPGKSPFGQLSCARCHHVLCRTCYNTEVLSWTQEILPNPVPVRPFACSLVPYGNICVTCGLTYRATRYNKSKNDSQDVAWLDFKTVCKCGESNSSKWRRFRVGSSQDWVLSPTECYGRAVEHLIANSVAVSNAMQTTVPEVPGPSRQDSLMGIRSLQDGEYSIYPSEQPEHYRPPSTDTTQDTNFEALGSHQAISTDIVAEAPQCSLVRRGAIRRP